MIEILKKSSVSCVEQVWLYQKETTFPRDYLSKLESRAVRLGKAEVDLCAGEYVFEVWCSSWNEIGDEAGN